MRFASWPYLIFILLIPILHVWWMNRNRPAKVKFSISIPDGVGRSNPLRWMLFLKYIGLILTILSLARPQWAHKETERTVSGVDIIMVMDVSLSMNAEDLAETSRLEVAKQTMRDFIKSRSNDRIGFVVFSGEPLTAVPPTLDYGLLLKALSDAETGTLKDGTAIGDGLALAVKRLTESKAKSRVIILLTDGDNNVGQIDPNTAGELAAGYGIKVYTIAIGREGRIRLPVRRQGAFGKMVTRYQILDNALNTELLQEIAQETKGKFYRVTDAEALDQVFKEIDQLEKSEVKSQERVRYEEFYEEPLKLGMLTLLVERILSLAWWRFIP